MIERILNWLFERHDIGRYGIDRYLTRWVLFGRRDPQTGMRRTGPGPKVFLHLFHRGDAEPYFHDHPWAFWSLILWGGYWEESLNGRKWCRPGSLLRRPAEWKHRVDVPAGQRCWTLLWIGSRVRTWGFWCPRTGWLHWKTHEKNQMATGVGCPE